MDPLAEIRKLARSLLGRRSGLEALDVKDVVMARAILDIHRPRKIVRRLNRVRKLNGLLVDSQP